MLFSYALFYSNIPFFPIPTLKQRGKNKFMRKPSVLTCDDIMLTIPPTDCSSV